MTRCLLYKDYESGYGNDVLSIELGVALAAMTGRTLVVYGTADDQGGLHPLRGGHAWHVPERRRHLIDTARRPTILDLLDPLPVPTLPVGEFRHRQRERRLSVLDSMLHLPSAAFIADDGLAPDRVAAFADGRQTFGDCDEDVFHLHRCNLGYYARAIYPLHEGLLHTLAGVRVRPVYRALADRVAAGLGRFNGVHVRLTDFRQFLPHAGTDHAGDVLRTLQSLFDPRELLVISTDEPDNADFFAPIVRAFPRSLFIDAHLVDHHGADFAALPFCDETAFGVVCNLVMQHADGFCGTPGSTFSGLIHRAWGRRLLARGRPWSAIDFRYVTSGSAPGEVAFDRGAFRVTRRGPFSWNRIALPRPSDMLSWYREWPEALLPSSELPPMAGPTAAAAHIPAPRVTVVPMDVAWLGSTPAGPARQRQAYARSESQAPGQAQPQAHPKAHLQAQPQTQPQAQPDARSQAQSPAQPQPRPQPQAQPDPQPHPQPQAQSLTDREIETLLLADALPAWPEADATPPPLAMSQSTEGRSGWVRWALAGFLAVQLAWMWWPQP